MQPEDRIRELLAEGEALVDKHRLAIMLYLTLRGKARFKEIAEGLSITSGNLAHHLKMLEERGYVKVEKEWKDLRARIITITPEGYKALAKFINALKEIT